MKLTVKDFTFIAIIGAIYTVLTITLPFQYGNIQIRIAEAMTLLPLLNKKSIYGIVLGCFLANLIGAISGANILGFMDIIIGTFASLIAAYITYYFKDIKINNIPVISLLSPVIVNGIIIGIELGVVLTPTAILQGSIINGIYVMVGEFIAIVFGYFLIQGLKNTKLFD